MRARPSRRPARSPLTRLALGAALFGIATLALAETHPEPTPVIHAPGTSGAALENPRARRLAEPGALTFPREWRRVDGPSPPGAPRPRPHEVGEIRATEGESWPEWPAALTDTFGGSGPFTMGQRFDPADSFDRDGSLPRPFRILAIHWLVEDDQPTGTLDVFLMEDEGGHKPDRDAILGGSGWTVTGVGPGTNTLDVADADIVIAPPRMFHVVFQGMGAGNPVVAADDGLPNPGGTGDMHATVLICEDNCHPGCSPPVFGLFLTAAPDGSTRGNNFQVWLEVDFLEPAPEPLFVRHPDMAGCNRCAWGDFDGDGDVDAMNSGRRIWRNEGDGTFTDVTDAAFPAELRSTNGGLFADFDRDGDLDVWAQTGQCAPCMNPSPVNHDTILRNVGDTDGDGVPELEDVRIVDHAGSADAPLPGDDLPTEGGAVMDLNGDGWLDVYHANHVDWDTGDCWPDKLWIHDGTPEMTFTDATARSGVDAALLCGRGVTPGDFDGDGDVDVFVSNYRLNRDLLWENRGVTATDLPVLVDGALDRGVAGLERLGAYGHGIGSSWGDVDGDLDLDLLVGNLAHSNWLCFSDTTKLFLSSGEAGGFTFTDERPGSGIEYNEVHSDASLADFDNDGDLDVLITHVYDGWRTGVFENLGDTDGDGVPELENVFAEAGIGQRSAWGSAWADFDRDGDLDVWMRGGLYVNTAADAGTTTWLEVDLSATISNPHSIGARVTVEAGGRTQLREVFGNRGTSSQDDFVQHFGLGGATSAERVHVRWPSGCELELLDVAANEVLALEEPECLVPRFRLDVPAGREGRPERVTCTGAPVRFLDDSTGSPTSWEWDLDGDGVTDSADRNPEYTYAAAGTRDVTLTVSDGTSTRLVTRPVRVDDRPLPPDSGEVREDGMNFCESGLHVSWTAASWGLAGSGVYNLYRGVDEADALSREPIATGLTELSYLDVETENGVAYVYVVEAEDDFAPGGCDPGPHHGGNTARLVLDTGVVDRVQVPSFTTAWAEDADACTASGITIGWEPATWMGVTGTGSYHVYRVEGRCPEPFLLGIQDGDPRLAEGLTETSFTDETAEPGVAYTYLIQAEDGAPGLCRAGPSNRGSTTSVCVEAEVTDGVETGSADPGEVLVASRPAPDEVLLDWSATSVVPEAGEDWGVLMTFDPAAPDPGWTLLGPGRIAGTSWTDVLPAGGDPEEQRVRYYRATVLSPGGCPAADPFRE